MYKEQPREKGESNRVGCIQDEGGGGLTYKVKRCRDDTPEDKQ